FDDRNNNGLVDGAETGIQGVTITLTGTDDLGAAVNTTATTDVNGNYTFGTLRPGNYTITETQPGAFLDGKDSVGTAAGTPGHDQTSNITLTANTPATGYNFGELTPSSLAGTVYRDLNNSGIIDGGETGIQGVTVTLTGTDDLGAITPIVL